MRKVDRLLSSVKREINVERRKHKELENAIGRLTTDQLLELAYGEPSDERLKEIFSSVGSPSVLERG